MSIMGNSTYNMQATKTEYMYKVALPMPSHGALSKMSGCIGSINDNDFVLNDRWFRRGTCYLNLVIIRGREIDLEITYRPCGWSDADSDEVFTYANFSIFSCYPSSEKTECFRCVA